MGKHEHPALQLMRAEAAGHLTRFQTDLTVHDTRALSTRDPRAPFAWVLHTGATWLSSQFPRESGHKFAAVFVNAYGTDDCRFYFWDGFSLCRLGSAGALDSRIREEEVRIREEVE